MHNYIENNSHVITHSVVTETPSLRTHLSTKLTEALRFLRNCINNVPKTDSVQSACDKKNNVTLKSNFVAVSSPDSELKLKSPQELESAINGGKVDFNQITKITIPGRSYEIVDQDGEKIVVKSKGSILGRCKHNLSKLISENTPSLTELISDAHRVHEAQIKSALKNELKAKKEAELLALIPKFLDKNTDINLGEEIGQGGFGQVYIDGNDERYVLKDFQKTMAPYLSLENFDIAHLKKTVIIAILQEAELFRKYYGDASASIILKDDGTYLLRMMKVSGIPMVHVNTFPEGALDAYYDMLDKLSECKIMHSDFHFGNILYDEESNTFNPIDFSNAYDSFFIGTKSDKSSLNTYSMEHYQTALEKIIKNTPNSPHQGLIAQDSKFFSGRH